MLLHPSYVQEFKKFIDSFVKQYNIKYSFEDILNIFNLEYDDDSLNHNAVKGKKYVLSVTMNAGKIDSLQKHLRNK